MNVQVLLQENRDRVLEAAARYGAYNVRVFGSIARGEATAESDIDLLVSMEPGRSSMDLGGLVYELQNMLGVRVDLVTENGLRPRIREQVLFEAIPL